jgi:predicted MFS family arabinose efflux permease
VRLQTALDVEAAYGARMKDGPQGGVQRTPDALGLLRQRDFRLLFSAQVVSAFGDRLVTIALAFAVLELGGSASAVGLVLACGMLPLVGCLPIGGVVADRVSRRAVMVGADLVRLAAWGVLAVLLIAGTADIWMLAALAAAAGAATGFFNPASTGLLPLVVAPHALQRANGLRATAIGIGEIAGPVVAGVLVAVAAPGWVIAIDAATFGLSAACLLRLRMPAPGAVAESFLADLREGWAAFRSRTWVWGFVACIAVGNLLWGAWSALGPVVADRHLGGAPAWGTVLAALGAGGLAGGLLAMRVDPRRPLVLAALASAVLAVPLGLLALGVPVAVLVPGALLAGTGLMLANVVWESTLQRHVPADALSRVSAYDWFGSLAFYPLGLAIWGPVSVAIGVDAALWVAAVLFVVTTLAVLAVPDVRRLRASH